MSEGVDPPLGSCGLPLAPLGPKYPSHYLFNPLLYIETEAQRGKGLALGDTASLAQTLTHSRCLLRLCLVRR